MSSIPFVRFISIYLIFLLNHKFKFCIQQYIPVLLKILKYRNWCLITKCFFSICGKNSKIYSCKSINTLSYICCSVAKSCPTLCDLTGCNTLGFPRANFRFILCHPLLLPSVFPIIRVFCSESALCIGWPKYWSFSFSISPSNEYSLISFRIEWLDLLAVPGTLKSLLQYHSSKASVLQHSAFQPHGNH